MEKTIINQKALMQDLEECNMDNSIRLAIFIFQIMQMR